MGKLKAEVLGRGCARLDTGTHDSLLEASQFVAIIEKRQGLNIACLEEIAYSNKWIDFPQLVKTAEDLFKTGYGDYLLRMASSQEASGSV